MIESDREKYRHYKEQHEHTRVRNAHNQQKEEAEQQDHELRDDDVCENRANEESVFTFKERETVWAVMPNAKWLSDDLRCPTCRAKQSDTAI